MSWSLACNATKKQAKIQLANSKIHGTASAEERAKFDAMMAFGQELIDGAPESPGFVTIVELSVSGHGTVVSGMKFIYLMFADVTPAPAATP